MIRSVVVAPSGFKGRLSAPQVARALGEGVGRALPACRVTLLPMADGGAGTAEVIASVDGGRWRSVPTVDAYGQLRAARVLELRDGGWAFDAAEGPGWTAGASREQAVTATSAGLGLILAAARTERVPHLFIGLGDTGASDGGLGMLQALGAVVLPEGLAGIAGLAAARAVHLPAWDVPAEAWCDVDAPLTGPAGAVTRFGPQKGIPATDLPHYDRVMAEWGTKLERVAGRPLASLPGAGAAGGIGAALAALGVPLVPGGERLADLIGLEAAVRGADLVLTGEGRLDATTAAGKSVAVVARMAARHGVPVVAVVGEREGSAPPTLPLDEVFVLDAEEPGTLASRLAAAAGSLAVRFLGPA